ncbi:hybrid sensor histidine kinase/response regulator [Rheinheimera riviphila]|uniref:histidine kinase n=1 Tax=Rheinheimera riviphila TaxID=1834037 RepID=A0A437QMF1_9GAMM|nr:response regulator [Rheinheimera riviphila]RVU35620.1 hybrid sensor histidine kinase/response regulator [Rheinheimera riviphila]
MNLWELFRTYMLLLFIAFKAGAADFRHMDIRLPQNSVIAMLEDRQGYLWIGTGAGLVKYDGYQVQTFLHQPGVANSLSQNLVLDLLQGLDGSIWIATNNGINRYRDAEGFRRYLYHQGSIESDLSHRVGLLYLDPTGRLWAGGIKGLYLYDEVKDQFVLVKLPAGVRSPEVSTIRWQDDSLWFSGYFGLARVAKEAITTLNIQAELLYKANPVTDWLRIPQQSLLLSIGLKPNSFEKLAVAQFSSPLPTTTPLILDMPIYFFHCDRHQQCWGFGGKQLFRRLPDGQFRRYQFPDSQNFITDLLETANGELLVCIGTEIYRYQRSQDQFVLMTVEENKTRNSKTRLFESSDGSVWASSHVNGLFLWSPFNRKFQHILLPPAFSKPNMNVIRIIQEDAVSNTLWLANDSGQLLSAPINTPIQQPITDWQQYPVPGSVHTIIHSLYHIDKDRRLLGTSHGLLQWEKNLSEFVASPLQTLLAEIAPTAGASDLELQVLDIKRDGDCLWLATTAGLGCADVTGSKLLRWYGVADYPAFKGNDLHRIYRARDGALWLASTQGLLRFDPATERLLQFQYDANNKNSLSHNWVHGIWQQSEHEFWIATREGGLNLLRWHADAAPHWQRFGEADGLPTEVLYGILGDETGLLWLSSNQGIFSFNPHTHQVRVYQSDDGLQSTEFNFSVAHISQSGRFYFGGVAGANAFLPKQVQDNPVVPKILLAGLRVNEQPYNLTRLQDAVTPLVLQFDQNHLVFDALALQYADPKRNQYAWKLEGADGNWVYAGTNRQARYGALPPGNYQFWLKAANPDGVWSEPKLMISLKIRPHPLLSPWAYAVYLILLVASIWAYKRWRDQTEQQLQCKIQQGIARETALNKRLRIQFEHTAHEMRTPLMRLSTHLNRSVAAMQTENHQQALNFLQTADAAQQELHMLIQRQLDVEELKLTQGHQPLHLLARPIVLGELSRYLSYAQEKGLQLTHDIADVTLLAVPGVLELICDNLLSNAIKYTQTGGFIAVQLTEQPPWLELTISDNGSGIAKAEQDKVFLRHYRVAGQQHIAGSGEGLFLVKTCVDDAGGQLALHSAVGEGCSILVRLPAGDPLLVKALQTLPALQRTVVSIQTSNGIAIHPQRPAAGSETILLVEDHPGLLQDLHSLLCQHYHCIVADNGQLGWQLAKQELPDLVISDVMMEQNDSGFVLLTKLKSHIDTSHIPVVLLTALTDEQNRLKGMTHQADVYLSKPISEQAILASIETLLNQHWRVGEQIRRAMDAARQQPKPLSEAERFQAKIQGIFEHVYQDPEVQVQDIAAAFGKSASVLQKLAKQYLTQSLKESLRDFRLQQAERLLDQHSECSIDLIAEQCGFGSTRSLQRDFKEHFQLTPQQYREGIRPLQRPAARAVPEPATATQLEES